MPRGRSRIPSLNDIYRRLFRAFGPQHWWPAQTPFEVMVGAILTQATNWRNVERVIGSLRTRRLLIPQQLLRVKPSHLARLIRPVGYFRQKAARLRTFTRWYLRHYRGQPRRMFREELWSLRKELLKRPGIGPETADSILLYAGHQPIFVVDAYTKRIFVRHRIVPPTATSEATQHVAMERLPAQEELYNEFHALLVAVGKRYCHRRDPLCTECPLGDLPRIREVNRYG